MLRRSASGLSASKTIAPSFSTASDSPVSAASWARRLTLSRTRPSAGTTFPVSRSTTSPGTRSREEISCTRPSRRTLHRGDRHPLERGHRLLGAVLLRVAEDRVEDHDGEDDDGLDPVSERDREDRGGEEDEGHDVEQLLAHDGESAAPGPFRQLVRAVLLETRRRLGCAEAHGPSLARRCSTSSALRREASARASGGTIWFKTGCLAPDPGGPLPGPECGAP